jgi:YVTN family beta-propeller protein
MYNNSSNGTRAAPTRGFAAVLAITLAMGLASMASPAAAPFAYVANGVGTVSVIDTATNPPFVTATVPVGTLPVGVAVTPDGKHVYVTNAFSNNVSVIRTAANMVVATVPVGTFPFGVAVTPDGTHAYVTNSNSNTVSVIATATKTVVATVPVGTNPGGVAVTPDGTHAYVANSNSNTVSVIRTATNTVVATVPVGTFPFGVAVTPNGKHAYVTTSQSNTVSVIRTASNTVVATIPVGSAPFRVAVTPDGKHVYVTENSIDGDDVSVIDTATNTVVAVVPLSGSPSGVAVTPDGAHVYVAKLFSNKVAVIATATNTVVARVPVGTNPAGVAIVPPPPGVPFLAFSATALDIAFGAAPNEDSFNLHSNFTLSSTAPGINPVTDPVSFQVGTFSITIPPGSFTPQLDGSFFFLGVINGVSLKARITPTGTLRYAFHGKATGASLTGTKNPVYVTLIIGGDSGATSVTATISP